MALSVAFACIAHAANDGEPSLERFDHVQRHQVDMFGNKGPGSDRLIIKYKNNSNATGKSGHILVSKLQSAIADTGLPLKLWRKKANGALVLKMDQHQSERSLQVIMQKFAADSAVEYVEIDQLYTRARSAKRSRIATLATLFDDHTQA